MLLLVAPTEQPVIGPQVRADYLKATQSGHRAYGGDYGCDSVDLGDLRRKGRSQEREEVKGEVYGAGVRLGEGWRNK